MVGARAGRPSAPRAPRRRSIRPGGRTAGRAAGRERRTAPPRPAPAPASPGTAGSRNASSTNSLPWASTQCSVLVDVALAVGVVLRAGDLVEAQPDQAEGGLPGGDPLGRGQADRARDPLADPGRVVEHDLAGDRAVARADQLLGGDRVERVAPLRPGESPAVEGVERRGRRPGVADERAEVDVEGHLTISRGGAAFGCVTRTNSADDGPNPPMLSAVVERSVANLDARFAAPAGPAAGALPRACPAAGVREFGITERAGRPTRRSGCPGRPATPSGAIPPSRAPPGPPSGAVPPSRVDRAGQGETCARPPCRSPAN